MYICFIKVINLIYKESIKIEKKYGPAKKLEEATRAKEDAMEEYLSLIESKIH